MRRSRNPDLALRTEGGLDPTSAPTPPPQKPKMTGPAPRSGGLLLRALARNWWMFVVRGLAAIAFGVLAFAWAGATLPELTLLWAAYAFLDGAVALGAAVSGKGATRWWLALTGLVGVLGGVIAVLWPAQAALALLYVIAAWAIAIGVVQVIGAIRLRKDMRGEWFLVLSGVVSIAFGALLFAAPDRGAAVLPWMFGLFALLLGVAYILFGWRLRKHRAGA